MEYSPLMDNPGVELDAELAQRILKEGDYYTEQTAHLALFIHKNKARYRHALIDKGLIQEADESIKGFDLAAVDGASATKAHGGGTTVAAVAYKVTINDQKQRGDTRVISLPNSVETDAFAAALRIHLELTLLAKDEMKGNVTDDMLVILDHSFWGVMQAISRALATYKTQYESLAAEKNKVSLNAMIDRWQSLFKVFLGKNGALLRMMKNKQVISLSKTAISSYFVKELTQNEEDEDSIFLSSIMNDRALLKHVLEVGEYTKPITLYQTTVASSEIKSWKRSRFATAFTESPASDPFVTREEVLDHYGVPRDNKPGVEISGQRLFVTYYRPYAWSRVYRIEFHEQLLRSDNGKAYELSGSSRRFQTVLASVKKSINPETKEPIAQVLADQRAKAAVAAALNLLPERAFYQLREAFQNQPDLLDIVDTLLSEERT